MNENVVKHATRAEDRLHIMLIEDNLGDRILFSEEILTTALAEAKLIFAGSFEEAKQLNKTYPIDIIFSDLNLPDYHGEETLRAIVNELFPLPVIILSAIKDEGLKRLAYGFGMQDYLVKGTDLNENRLLKAMLSINTEISQNSAQIKRMKAHLSAALVMVQESTKRLNHHLNHEIRGPICRLEGLLNLIQMNETENNELQAIMLLTKETLEKLKMAVDSSVQMMSEFSFQNEDLYATIDWPKLVNEEFHERVPANLLSRTTLTLFGTLKYFFFKGQIIKKLLKILIDNSTSHRSAHGILSIVINANYFPDKVVIVYWDNNKLSNELFNTSISNTIKLLNYLLRGEKVKISSFPFAKEYRQIKIVFYI